MAAQIKTAVFPVAGLGTRFLPITKAIPKEMMPIGNKPLIQYAVEEAIQSGIEKLIFVTSSSKGAIEDYFDNHYELESRLEASGKTAELSIVRNIVPPTVTLAYVRQSEPKGLGHAVLTAKALVGDEPFALLLADDLMVSSGEPVTGQLINAYHKNNASAVIAVQDVLPDKVDQYGIVSCDDIGKVHTIVEKPKLADAPSRLGVVGRYILSPDIFFHLDRQQAGVGGEIQLTDAISALLENQAVYAQRFSGERYDCGVPEGYMDAIQSLYSLGCSVQA